MTSITLDSPVERAPTTWEERISSGTEWWRQLLSIPLIGKLAGANVLIVAVAATMGMQLRAQASQPTLLLLLIGSLLLALVVNLVLVHVALRPLRQLEQTAERWWKGDFEARVPHSILADRDMTRVGNTFNLLVDNLISDRARTRRLAAEVIHAGDRERAHLAHELHDSTAQELAALVFHLSAAARDTSDPVVTARLEMIRDLASGAMEDVRLLSHSVYPRVLDDLGLPAAIRALAREASLGVDDVTIDARVSEGLAKLPPSLGAALYRVTQEAVANALRHGMARSIRIEGGVTDSSACVEIVDDGAGFDLAEAERRRPGMGIFAMRERVSLAEGEIDIVSAPGEGTRISVKVPLHGSTSTPPDRT